MENYSKIYNIEIMSQYFYKKKNDLSLEDIGLL